MREVFRRVYTRTHITCIVFKSKCFNMISPGVKLAVFLNPGTPRVPEQFTARLACGAVAVMGGVGMIVENRYTTAAAGETKGRQRPGVRTGEKEPPPLCSHRTRGIY